MIVQNMTSNNGNKVPNQFDIQLDGKWYFQSYSTVIAMKDKGQTYLDKNSWDYSVTTSRYRNQWLGMTTKEVKDAIKFGEIKLIDLNK